MKIDVKSVLLILGFFGVTSIGTLLTPVFGWIIRPVIESAHTVWLVKVDSLEAVKLANLKDWIKTENMSLRSDIEDLRETMAEVPAIHEGIKRRKARLKLIRDLGLNRESASTLKVEGDVN